MFWKTIRDWGCPVSKAILFNGYYVFDEWWGGRSSMVEVFYDLMLQVVNKDLRRRA